jgi:hypothetical protein
MAERDPQRLLDEEIATYHARRSELGAHVGKFVLIAGKELVGVFDTYADALRMGYERFGLEPFLVRQIAPVDQILHFSRDLPLNAGH